MIEKPDIKVFTETQLLATAAVHLLVKDLQIAIGARGRASWVIAGGSTPLAAYEILANDFSQALDWSKVDVVIGDERCVPFDSPDSNWTSAERALAGKVTFSSFTSRPKTNVTAEEAAGEYERYLSGLPQTETGLPVFDHVWLGVGEDGHTLSLFPGHPSSLPTERLVIAVHDSPKPPPDRISLTFKALQAAANCLVLAAGAGKASVIGRALDGDVSLPVAKAAATVHTAGGKVSWLLDKAAASMLSE